MPARNPIARTAAQLACALLVTCALALGLASCGGGTAAADEGATEGPSYSVPAAIETSAYDAAAAQVTGTAGIDVSHAAQGYAGASATADSRLKFQVSCGEMSYNYDLPQDGTPIVVPLNMGDGEYTFRVMQNTSGNNYAEIARVEQAVELASEFEPYLRPNVFCSYSDASPVVELARELAAGAANEGDVARAVYEWVVANISYDYDKAAELGSVTGYVPSPDRTLEERTGICFDYASLTGAMLRSLGIPCKVITGYVAPDDIYHAWNMIYIDGRWATVEFSIDPDTWSRVDLTFAAAGAGDTVGDGSGYTDRYTY